MINLIPYNSTSVAANYRAPSREHCLHFQSILQNSYGLFTTTRVEMGADIDGACGQLALENQNLVLKPRGLHDDTALPSEEMMPTQPAASSSCASPGSPAPDIEDFLAPGGSGAAGKRPAPAVLSKRRGRASGVAADTNASAAAVSASASCCTDGSSCDCESATATASETTASSTVAAAPAAASGTGEKDDESASDDELTVGEILAREGIQRRAGPVVSSGLAAAPEPFLTPAEVARLRVREELRSSWDNRERLQLVVFAVAVITLLAILRHSYGF